MPMIKIKFAILAKKTVKLATIVQIALNAMMDFIYLAINVILIVRMGIIIINSYKFVLFAMLIAKIALIKPKEAASPVIRQKE